jgi:PilZ domain-containing protein
LPVFGTIYVQHRANVSGAEYTCACFDVSPKGIGIESPGPITVGSTVTVRMGDRGPKRAARVRYCDRDTETFRVGLEFVGPADFRRQTGSQGRERRRIAQWLVGA